MMQNATSNARFGKSAERRYPRFRVHFPIKLFGNAVTCEGQAHDLSEGGIAVQIPAQVGEGEQIRLQFTLPRSEWHFIVYARVKHTSAGRCGLEFHKLTRRESDELSRVCRALSASA